MNKKQNKELIKAARYCIDIMTEDPNITLLTGELCFSYNMPRFSNAADSASLEELRSHINAILEVKCGTIWMGVRENKFVFWCTI